MEPSDRSASWVTVSARQVRRGGSAHVLSLEGVRKALGDRWSRQREAVAAALDAVLRRHLGPADAILPLDEMNHLILMPKASTAEGEAVCLRAAYDLCLAMIGSCRADQLTFAPASAVGDTIIEVTPLPREAIVALALQAGLALAPPIEDMPGGDAVREEVRAVYQPVWDGEVEVIRAYRCQPADGWRARGFEGPAQRLRLASHLTLALFQRSTEALAQQLVRGERSMLIVPVSFDILHSPASREAFLAAARAMDDALRLYLAFEVKDLSYGIPQSRVAEVVSILQAFCSLVVARLPRPAGPALSSFRNAGVKALGVSLKGLPASQYDREIAALVGETRRSAMMAYATHVDSSAALGCCLKRGVKWMCGTAVAPAVMEPGPLMRLSRMNLLKDSAAA